MADRITDKQLRWIQQLWTQKHRDGLIASPTGLQFAGDEREQRLEWARQHLGYRKLATFSDLTVSQAGYLLDILNGKQTKLDGKLQALFAEREIASPEAWFEAFQARANHWKFRGAQLHQLNRWQKIELVNVLATRGDETNRPAARRGIRWRTGISADEQREDEQRQGTMFGG